ncbi:hypothetical protein NE237_017205 [Protea cynaroides]|uniref:Uncharacterized protein n=1 Tax=Protea cynaroides TaxID=273540 RepID=A0A9Q0K7M9_9MAGN|nr:hypothetical protein NE237_017205 [Protea cynaroides]
MLLESNSFTSSLVLAATSTSPMLLSPKPVLPHSTAILLEPNSITQLQPSHTLTSLHPTSYLYKYPSMLTRMRGFFWLGKADPLLSFEIPFCLPHSLACSSSFITTSRNHPLFASNRPSVCPEEISHSANSLVPSGQSVCPESAPSNILCLADSLILARIRAQQHLAPNGQSNFVQNLRPAASHDHGLTVIRVQQPLAFRDHHLTEIRIQQPLVFYDHRMSAIRAQQRLTTISCPRFASSNISRLAIIS